VLLIKKCCTAYAQCARLTTYSKVNCASRHAKSSYSYADTCACKRMACNNPSRLSCLEYSSAALDSVFEKVQKCMIALSQVHATSVKSDVCLEAVDKIQPLIAHFWWNAKAGKFCKLHAILSTNLACPLTAECCLDGSMTTSLVATTCTALMHSAAAMF